MRKNNMKFKSLTLEIPEWGENKDNLIAELCIRNEKTKMTMQLPPEVAGRILQVAKNALINGANLATNEFISGINTSIPDFHPIETRSSSLFATNNIGLVEKYLQK